MPAAPTLHFSEVQAGAEAVEGDLVGELEANPLVVAQKAVEVVVIRIGELQLVKNLVEDSCKGLSVLLLPTTQKFIDWVEMGCAEWGWNVLDDLEGDQEVVH